MTTAFRKYWRDVTIPCLVSVLVSPVYHIINGGNYGIIYGITAPVAFILALRLCIEPIHASTRRQAKLALNAKFGKLGYSGGRVEPFGQVPPGKKVIYRDSDSVFYEDDTDKH